MSFIHKNAIRRVIIRLFEFMKCKKAINWVVLYSSIQRPPLFLGHKGFAKEMCIKSYNPQPPLKKHLIVVKQSSLKTVYQSTKLACSHIAL